MYACLLFSCAHTIITYYKYISTYVHDAYTVKTKLLNISVKITITFT